MAGPYDGWTEEPVAPTAAPSAPPPNDFAGWTEESPEQVDEERKDSVVLKTFERTFGANVERQAQVAKLAEETGLDAGLVDRQFDALTKSVGAGKFDARAWRKANPALAELVLKRPELGPVAMQDQALPHIFGDDSARMLSGGFYKGLGSTVRGVGAVPQILGDLTTTRLSNALTGRHDRTGNVLDPIANWLQQHGEGLQAGVSAETKAQTRGTQIGGDLLKPETWTLGEDPSVSGVLLQGLDVFGGMLPLVASSLAGAPPAVPGVLGGLQGGGGADEQARQTIAEMAATPTSDAPGAPSRLEAESELYRDLRAQGLTHEQATQRVQDAAARWAFIITAPISAGGDIFTAANINPFAHEAKEGAIKALVNHVVGGALEEGFQESGETIATNLGTNLGGGTSVPLSQGTFGDFVLGALSGGAGGLSGASGAVADAFHERRTKRAQRLLDAAKNSPLANASEQAFAEWAKAEGAKRGEDLSAVHVDANAVMQLFQEHDADPAQAAREMFGEDGEAKLKEALATGTKIEIPIESLPRMSRHPLAGKLREHVSGSAADFTANEKKTKASELDQQQKALVQEFEAGEVPAESEAEAGFLAALEGQLAATGVNDKKAAKHGVALWRAFVRTQAARQGVAQDQLFERYTVAVERGNPAAAGDLAPARIAAQDVRMTQDPDDYRGSHKAPGPHNGAPGHDVTTGRDGGIYPPDVYSKDGARLYGTGSRADAKAFRIAQQLRGKPDAELTIYRAVPSKAQGNDIRPGDWVAITKEYAEDHGEATLDGDFRIIEKKVRASEIFTNGDSIQEWGYAPAEESKRLYAGPASAPRGFMERASNAFRIVLNKNADLSTFLHETGHVFLEMQGDLAERGDAPQQVKDDYQAILDWFGVSDRNGIQREHHEKFARGFELYLREGNAPSRALEGAFTRFRIWLTRIYKQATALNVELSDEVRGVFDRMLATDDEIKRARARAGIPEKPVRLPGQSDEDYAKMVDALDRAEKAASKAATLRALELRKREQESWWKEEKAKFHAEAAEEYDSLPATRASRYVLRSEVEGVKLDPPVRLSRPEVEALIGKDAAKPLNHVLTKDKKKQQRLDDVAAELGYANGRELLNTILSHPTREQYADEVANRRMAQEHGDILADKAELAKRIDEVLHSEVGYEDAALMEYVTLTAQAGGDHPAVEAIRRSAAEIAQNRAIGKINPARVLEDERRANQRYYAAMVRKDLRAAVKAKREALLNHFLYREMVKAEKAREGFEDLAHDLNNNRWRAKVGQAEPELRDASDGLLIALGLRTPDAEAKPFPGAAVLAGRMNSEMEEGVPALFDPQDVDQIIDRRRGKPGEITVEEMAVLRKVLEQVKKAGSVLSEMYVNDLRRGVQETADTVAVEASAEKDLGLEEKDITARTAGRGVVEKGLALAAQHERPEAFFERLGPTAHAIWKGIEVRAKEVARKLFADIGAEFTKRWDAMPKEMQERRFDLLDASGLPVAGKTRRQEGHVTREWLWMLVLNWGNDGNRQRLLDGYGWSEEQVVAFIEQHIDETELEFLQGVLDVTNRLRDPAAAVFEEVHGIRPGRVQASSYSFRLSSGKVVTFKGGYFPARADTQARDRTHGRQAMRQAESGVQDARSSAQASIAQGFTKQRAAKATAPLSLNFAVVPAHLSQVIHYIAYEPQVRAFNRLLQNDTFRETVERRLGKPYLLRMEQWIKDIAGTYDENVGGGMVELLGELGLSKSNFVAATLSLNIRSFGSDWLEVFTPFFDKSTGIGKMHVVKAAAKAVRHYQAMREEAEASSPEILKRGEAIGQTLQRTTRKIGKSKSNVARFAEHNREKIAFHVQEAMDKVTSTILWHAAKDAAVEEAQRDGTPPEQIAGKANELADDKLRKTKAPATMTEQSAMMRDKKTLGAVLTFFGWRNHMGTLWRRMIRERGFRGFAEGWALLALTNTLGGLFIGDGPDDDESWAEWAARKSLAAPAIVIPIFGGAWEEAANRIVSGKHRRLSLMGAGWAAGAERSWNLMNRAWDEKDAGKGVILVASALAIPLALPSTQFQRSAVGIYDMMMGNSDVDGVIDAADQAVFGSDESRPLSILGLASGRGKDIPLLPR